MQVEEQDQSIGKSSEKIASRNSNPFIPKVSVIIPTYNRLDLLEEALSSVIAQKFDGGIEIIVIDDNSTDGTVEVIKQKYPDVYLSRLSTNLGPSAARNKGIVEARGKFVAFLDSDDLWKPDYLTTQIAKAQKFENCLCVSSLEVWNVNKDSRITVIQRPELERYTSPIHHFLVSTFIRTLSSVIVPVVIFEKIGYFDENLRTGEDVDFYLRCLGAGFELLLTDEVFVIKREHGQGQITDPENLKLREKCRLARVKKFYLSHRDYEGIPPISKIFTEVHSFFAKLYLANNMFFPWLMSSFRALSFSPTYFYTDILPNIKFLSLRLRKKIRTLRGYGES